MGFLLSSQMWNYIIQNHKLAVSDIASTKQTCKLILHHQRGLAIQGSNWTTDTKGKQYAHVSRITDE